MSELQNLLRILTEMQEESTKLYKTSCDDFWENLSKEDQLKAFYSVISRVYEGEIKDRGSYRYILYDKFGFGPEAYSIGMDCGYLYLHNAIFDGENK